MGRPLRLQPRLTTQAPLWAMLTAHLPSKPWAFTSTLVLFPKQSIRPGHVLTFFTHQLLLDLQDSAWNFRDGPRVKNLPANAGDTGSILHAVEQLTHAPQLLCLCSGAWRCNYGCALQPEKPLQ